MYPRADGVEHIDPVVDGLRVHCALAGEGPPLVLLHGWPQHWWSWRSVIGPLAKRYRVICPDIRGMGWTAAPPLLYLRPWHIYLLASPIGPPLVHAVARNRLHAWRKAGRFSDEETDAYMSRLGTVATLARDRQIVRRDIPWFFRHARRLRLRVPTLHLNGELDPLTRGVPHSHRRFADDMSLELVPDCGHFIAEERPEWLLDRLEAFLGSGR